MVNYCTFKIFSVFTYVNLKSFPKTTFYVVGLILGVCKTLLYGSWLNIVCVPCNLGSGRHKCSRTRNLCPCVDTGLKSKW